VQFVILTSLPVSILYDKINDMNEEYILECRLYSPGLEWQREGVNGKLMDCQLQTAAEAKF
jgi:hypothetical protein